VKFLSNMRPDFVNRHLDLVLQRAVDDLERGAIVSVREDLIDMIQGSTLEEEEECIILVKAIGYC